MEKPFLSQFPKPATTDWVAEIKRSVKDPKELEKLIWETPDGFTLNSFYRAEDTAKLHHAKMVHKLPSNNWQIVQPIQADKVMAANQFALEALETGADTLYFEASDMLSESELNALLKGIHLDWISTAFHFGESNVAAAYILSDYLKQAGYDTAQLKGAIHVAPLTELYTYGDFNYPQRESFEILKSLVQPETSPLPQFRYIHIKGVDFRNAGATPAMELAYSLSAAVEYLHQLTELQVPISQILRSMEFHLGTGSDYFLEIAKYRAFRYLWNAILENYQTEWTPPHVNAHSITWNKSIFDAHTNLLRQTCEAMAAAMGGVTSITLPPYDAHIKEPGAASHRWARNIQLILKEEAHLDKVIDPGAGAYYIEQATDKLITAAWALFIEAEKEGGFIASLQSKLIQRKIETAAQMEKEALQRQQRVVVGTSKYILKNERLTGTYTFVPENILLKEHAQIIPIRPTRLTETLDADRLKLEA